MGAGGQRKKFSPPSCRDGAAAMEVTPRVVLSGQMGGALGTPPALGSGCGSQGGRRDPRGCGGERRVKKPYNAPGCPQKKLLEGHGSGPRAAAGEDGDRGPSALHGPRGRMETPPVPRCRCPSCLRGGWLRQKSQFCPPKKRGSELSEGCRGLCGRLRDSRLVFSAAGAGCCAQRWRRLRLSPS